MRLLALPIFLVIRLTFRELDRVLVWIPTRAALALSFLLGLGADDTVDAAESARVKAAYDLTLEALELPVFLFSFVLVHQTDAAQTEAENAKQERLDEEVGQDVGVAQTDIDVDDLREGQAEWIGATSLRASLIQHDCAPNAQTQKYQNVDGQSNHMQNKSVPEAKESTTEELADNDSKVFEHHEDEVALQDDTMV